MPMNLRIRHEWGEEELAGWQIRPGVYKLTTFSEHVPLATGDEVTVSDGVVTGIADLAADLYVVAVHFSVHATEDLVRDYAAIWRRATAAQQSSSLTVLVASSSTRWLAERVYKQNNVEMVEVMRKPGETVDLPQAIRDT